MENSNEKLKSESLRLRQKEASRKAYQAMERDRAARLLVHWLARLAVRISNKKNRDDDESDRIRKMKSLWNAYKHNIQPRFK